MAALSNDKSSQFPLRKGETFVFSTRNNSQIIRVYLFKIKPISMEKTQIALLLELANRLEKKAVTKESAIKTLNGAGIVTPAGNIKKAFPHLKRVLSTVTD